jgi:hypothetical protein
VETSIAPLNVENFRVPGASAGAGTGKVTTIEGIDPASATITGMGGDEETQDEKVDFCVASVKKSDLLKQD